MKFGSTEVIQPPGTHHLLRVRTYSGYGRRGLTYWSDGYLEGPHFPPVLNFLLLRDPIAGTPFLLFEAERVGAQIDPLNRLAGELDEWDSVPFADVAAEGDYAFAVENLIEDAHDEDEQPLLSVLRHHWWWTSNQPRRKDPALPLSASARANMEAIVDETTDATDYARLLRCELYRELGDFLKAIAELASPFSRPRIRFMDRLFPLIMAKDTSLSSYRRNPYP